MTGIGNVLGIVLMSLTAHALQAEVPPLPSQARLVESYGQRPLAFEENRGQTDGRVRFLSRGQGYTIFLTPDEAVLALHRGDSVKTLRLRWLGAAPAPRVSGEEELPGRSHYFLTADPARWRTKVPSYGRVRYREVYPGTDLVFYGNPRQLEYDFVLAPGSDPGRIRLAVAGAERIVIDPSGDLVLSLGDGTLRLRRPIAYQEIEGVRRKVESRYRFSPAEDWSTLGFEVAAYDPGRTLVIDPVLAYSSFLGGSGREEGKAIAVDGAGNAYVTGFTYSSDFPLQGPLDDDCQPAGSCQEVFVAKLDPVGSLVYSTYLGGSGDDQGEDIAVDDAGNAYVVGLTRSGPDFPRVNPLPGPVGPQYEDAFVAKLDPTGSTLVYSTTFGGASWQVANAVAVDSHGQALIAGSTSSMDFPTVDALSPVLRGGMDGFVAKLSASGSSLVYSTYLGGSEGEEALGMATDSAGNAYVCGLTNSDDFPVQVPLQPHRAGWRDGFVAKLSPTGSLVYSTYLGGSRDDAIHADLAADAAGNAYVFGYTESEDFPVLQPLWASGNAFLGKLDPAGGLVFSTLLDDLFHWPTGVALDSGGNVHLAGFTLRDARVAKLAPDAAGLLYSVVLGGTAFGLEPEGAWGIAADANGNAYVTGVTISPDFPVVNAFQPVFADGEKDAFISKLVEDRPPDCAAAFASPAFLWPPNGKLWPVAVRGVTDPEGDPVAIVVTAIRQDEPLGKRSTADASGVGSSTARLRADRSGGGNGRVYHVSFEAADPQGGTCLGSVTVCVPHDRRAGAACVDGGALFDSTGAEP